MDPHVRVRKAHDEIRHLEDQVATAVQAQHDERRKADEARGQLNKIDDVQAFLKKVADSHSKYAKEARTLLDT